MDSRKISKAPPPISPVMGRGSFSPRRPAATQPKWDEWIVLGVVIPWEAAALSIGLEPRSINQWQSNTFPDDEAFESFKMRRRIIEAQAGWHASCKIRLVEFADWAAGSGLGVPDDLLKLVSKQMPESCPTASEHRAVESDGGNSSEESIGVKIRARNFQLKAENCKAVIKTLADEFNRSESTIKKHLYGQAAKSVSMLLGNQMVTMPHHDQVLARVQKK